MEIVLTDEALEQIINLIDELDEEGEIEYDESDEASDDDEVIEDELVEDSEDSDDEDEYYYVPVELFSVHYYNDGTCRAKSHHEAAEVTESADSYSVKVDESIYI